MLVHVEPDLAVHRHGAPARDPTEVGPDVADVAGRIADGAAALDIQYPATSAADEEVAAVGPIRAGAADRRRARRAGLVAQIARRGVDRDPIADRQRTVASIAHAEVAHVAGIAHIQIHGDAADCQRLAQAVG